MELNMTNLIIHVVEPGDTIYAIAQKYGVSPNNIMIDNQISDPRRLVPGQALVIMRTRFEHTAQLGESLYSIAASYEIPLDELIRSNPDIADPNVIFPGQIIQLPHVQQRNEITVNGFMHPPISRDDLQAALPSLTYLSPFSYHISPDGSLSSMNDSFTVQAANRAGVIPCMVITNITREGEFSLEIANTVLNSEQAQTTLLNNCMEVIRTKGYRGLVVDFEFILPQDREKYSAFLESAARRLHAEGYDLLVVAAPKTSADQPGLAFEGHDYNAFGRISDYVILRTYEGYGPPMLLSPINELKQVLDYAVTAIPNEKILLGIPFYGYDWTLPYAEGTQTRALSPLQAVELAMTVGTDIEYDTKAAAAYFYYYDDSGRQHFVSFLDARSVFEKLKLVNRYQLGGISYWTGNNRFEPANLIVGSLYMIRKA